MTCGGRAKVSSGGDICSVQQQVKKTGCLIFYINSALDDLKREKEALVKEVLDNLLCSHILC